MLHGDAFTDQQWLAQLATYCLEQIGGMPALAATFVFADISSLAFAARGLGAEPRAVVVVLAFAWWLTLMPAQICQAALVPDVSVFVSPSM